MLIILFKKYRAIFYKLKFIELIIIKMEWFEVYSKSIDPEIIKIIDNEIPYTATGLCYWAAKMFYLDKKDKEWKDMNLEGALVFVVDRVLNSRFIMMYSLQNYTKLFYTEMYVDFKKNWIKINDGFYAFPWEKMIVGISFGEKEGNILYVLNWMLIF